VRSFWVNSRLFVLTALLTLSADFQNSHQGCCSSANAGMAIKDNNIEKNKLRMFIFYPFESKSIIAPSDKNFMFVVCWLSN
jgi:hypothetical protein